MFEDIDLFQKAAAKLAVIECSFKTDLHMVARNTSIILLSFVNILVYIWKSSKLASLKARTINIAHGFLHFTK
jgi:hypothetical protein